MRGNIRHWLSLVLLAMVGVTSSIADPQHWGFGFSYLVTLEQRGMERALSIYAPPMQVRDGAWLLRWRDVRSDLNEVMPRGLVVGDFWPAAMSAEQVLLLRPQPDEALAVETIAPPEVFSTAAWTSRGTTRLPLKLKNGQPIENFIAATSGDLLGKGSDQLIVLAPAGNENRYVIVMFTPPSAPDSGSWRAEAQVIIQPFGQPVDITVGDFWGTGKPRVALLATRRADTVRISYWDVTQPSFETYEASRVAQDAVPSTTSAPAFFEAADFQRDGLTTLAIGSPSMRSVRFITRTAPRLKTDYHAEWVAPGETLAGATVSDIAPGQAKRLMLGERDGAFGAVVAADAGRTFGYIEAPISERSILHNAWRAPSSGVDVEIVAMRRLPEYRLGIPDGWHDGTWLWLPDEHFGWPKLDEDVTYEILLKNNGPQALASGDVTVELWTGVTARNADLLPNAGETRTTQLKLNEPLPPFNPRDPRYVKVTTSLKWPYKLEQPAGWTWSKLNLREVGQRWLIARVSADNDVNLRNNRYEVALHAKELRAVIRDPREYDAQSAEAPTVSGDPGSYTYRLRKLADALQVVWERARTEEGGDVWQAVTLTAPRIGWPATRNDDYSLYDVVREVDPSVGVWGNGFLFGAQSADNELRMTGCALHPIRDPLRDRVSPTDTRLVRDANGDPTVHSAQAWGADICATGHTMVSLLAADLQHQLEGVRYAGVLPVEGLSPKSIAVRVLDRAGQPVPDADVAWHVVSAGKQEKVAEGKTDENGVWQTGMPGEAAKKFPPFGWNIYSGSLFDPGAYVVRMKKGDYTESAIVGLKTQSAHSRKTLAHAAVMAEESWTWDFETQYDASAKTPSFKASAAIAGSNVTLAIQGQPNRTYRVYRQAPPREALELIGEYPGTREPLAVADTLPIDPSDADRPQRATYWISEVNNGQETLPLRIEALPLAGVNGITANEDNTLLVTLNSGAADPVLVRFDATRVKDLLLRDALSQVTPFKALHLSNEKRYLMTIEPPAQSWRGQLALAADDSEPDSALGHGLLTQLAALRVRSFTSEKPYEIVLEQNSVHPPIPILPGDRVVNPLEQANAAMILSMSASRYIVDHLIFNVGQLSALRLNVNFAAGTLGDQLDLRQLRQPRGLAELEYRGKDYILIADTGNRRIVMWTPDTEPVAEFSTPGWNPVAIAAHPINTGQFFVLSRKSNRESGLYLMRYDGRSLSVLSGFPVPLDIGSASDGSEMGLCAGVEPTRRQLTLAVTDATQKRVLELARFGTQWRPMRTHTEALPPFSGSAELVLPTDAAYTTQNGELALFVVDGHRRVVRVR